jgi:hypothetical protein
MRQLPNGMLHVGAYTGFGILFASVGAPPLALAPVS